MTPTLRFWPHPDLKKVCLPVDPSIDFEFRSQLELMTKVMKAAGGIGLAANQLGILKRMLVAMPVEGPVAFVNPSVVGFTGKWVDVREGCLSIPGFYETVKRNTEVAVESLDLETGTKIVKIYTGKIGHILQHEIEHLDGKMFTDKLKPAQRDALRVFMRRNAKSFNQFQYTRVA